MGAASACPDICVTDNPEVTTVGRLQQGVHITAAPVLPFVDGQCEVPHQNYLDYQFPSLEG